jgi:hypothetical protein
VTKVNNCKNNNNNNTINVKKILVASIALVFLLSTTIFTQNQTILLSLLSYQQQLQQSSPSLSSFLSSPIPSLAHADKIKIKNKSLINDISDQLVKNNGNNGKDELQNILQQVQMQISLIAGQDKATNAIKQIESVIELNPNGPLAQSLLVLAKQQATGNIEDVNKVTTDIARYAASGGDNVIGLLEQTVAAAPSSPAAPSSSSIIPPSPQQQQQQQPSQSPTSSSTIASFGNKNTNINDNSNASFMATSPQITSHVESQGSSTAPSQTRGSPVSELPPYNAVQQNQQQISQSQLTESQQQPQKQEERQQRSPAVSSAAEGQLQNQPQSDIDPPTSPSSNSSSILSSSKSPLVNSQNQQAAQPQSAQNSSLTLPPSQASLYPNYDNNGNNNAYDTSNANNTDNMASNSSPQSTIKITSSDQPTEASYPKLSLSTSNSSVQQNQNGGREQVEERIQEIMNQFNSVNRNDGATLPTYIESN